MKESSKDLLAEIGLAGGGNFFRDRLFWFAMVLGPAFWLVLASFGELHPIAAERILSWAYLSVALWNPVLEEIFFRGILQGPVLSSKAWARKNWKGFTLANLVVSVAFTLLHLFFHPILPALFVFFPAMIFGFFRDRHRSVYPAIVLHVFYNAGYFALTPGL